MRLSLESTGIIFAFPCGLRATQYGNVKTYAKCFFAKCISLQKWYE